MALTWLQYGPDIFLIFGHNLGSIRLSPQNFVSLACQALGWCYMYKLRILSAFAEPFNLPKLLIECEKDHTVMKIFKTEVKIFKTVYISRKLTRCAGAKRELRWQEKLVAKVGDRTPGSTKSISLRVVGIYIG